MTTQLNQQQINELLATEVMGWHEEYDGYRDKQYSSLRLMTPHWVDDSNERIFATYEWNPYNNIEQAFMVLDKLGEHGYGYTIERAAGKRAWCAVYGKDLLDKETGSSESSSLSAAICLAAVQVIQNDSH